MTVHTDAENRTEPAVSDEVFMANVREALENGHEVCCAACGVGVAADDADIHERACPEYRDWMA